MLKTLLGTEGAARTSRTDPLGCFRSLGHKSTDTCTRTETEKNEIRGLISQDSEKSSFLVSVLCIQSQRERERDHIVFKHARAFVPFSHTTFGVTHRRAAHAFPHVY